MIDLDNRTDKNYNFKLLEEILNDFGSHDIELILTDDVEIASINHEFRGINKATDVLSFPSDPFPNAHLGSIIISVDKVQSITEELGHTPDDELALLFIHGILHLLGFDHEIDNGEMRTREKELVKKFNLPLSLIVRTQG
jgi:probable rRNA maturation factor